MTTRSEANSIQRRFDAALALHQNGQIQEAEAFYRAILEVDSDHAGAWLNLGVIALQKHEATQAVPLIEAAIARDPGSATARSHLGTALHLLQRNHAALEHYEEALGLDPDMAEAHYGLGNVLQVLGRTDEAAACYQRAIALDPDYAEAYCGLGNACQARKLYKKAAAAYEAALATDPDYSEALCGLGRTRQSEFRYAEAMASYEKALAVDPNDPSTHSGLGAALQALDRYEEALHHFEHALSLDFTHADARCRLAVALQEVGRVEEAQRHLEFLIKREPRRPQHYYLLSNARRMEPGDPHLAAMEQLANDMGSLDTDGQIHLLFALAKSYADCGEHDRSFRHLFAGNMLKRRQIPYDEAATVDMLERIAALFTRDFLQARRPKVQNSAPDPIFIVGMPRCGSTLVEQVLAGHADVAACGERPDMRDSLLAAAADDAAASRFPEFVARLSSRQISAVGEHYKQRIARVAASIKPAALRFTDKTLNNFCLIGIIRLALPNAKILHCRRDPVDTCLSCFSQLFAAELLYTYDLAELGRYYRHYAALMEHWRQVLPQDAMLEVSYERLVNDFEPEVRRILDYCQLTFDPQCLDFQQTRRPVRTASVVQVREPLHDRSIGRVRPRPDLLHPLEMALRIKTP